MISIGDTFGRLTVVAIGIRKRGQLHYTCSCQCGNVKTVYNYYLRAGKTRSCGCYRKEVTAKLKLTHGIHGEWIYSVWRNMIRRCYDKQNKSFKDYGYRGITVCEFLRASPQHLLALMGNRPSSTHSVHRPNNDGSYSCGQCAECVQRNWLRNAQWATPKEQARNTTRTRLFQIGSESKTCGEWAEQYGSDYHSVYRRLRKGNGITWPTTIPA